MAFSPPPVEAVVGRIRRGREIGGSSGRGWLLGRFLAALEPRTLE